MPRREARPAGSDAAGLIDEIVSDRDEAAEQADAVRVREVLREHAANGDPLARAAEDADTNADIATLLAALNAR